MTFKMISPFMDPVTKNKIKFVYDANGKQDTKATANEWVHIHDYIAPDQLESEYGGDFFFKFDIDTYWDRLLETTGKPYKVIDY